MTEKLNVSQSAMAYEAQGNRTYGGGARGVDYIRLGVSQGASGNNWKFWGLYAFPALPPGAHLQSAVLVLHAPDSVFDAPDGNRIFPTTYGVWLKVRAIRQAWSQETVNWNNRPTVDTIAYPELTVPAGAFPQTLRWDVTDVYNAQKATGYGFAIIPAQEWASRHVGVNRNNAEQPLPYLEVTYTPEIPPMGIYINIDGVARACNAFVKDDQGGPAKRAISVTYRHPDGTRFTV